MNNFLDFIRKDIEAKKILIANTPTKTKTNKKKFNATIDKINDKYEEYLASTRNYLLAKARSFEVNEVKTNVDRLKEKIEQLEHVRFLLNPHNTYVEKMGFDDLVYQISNYDTFNFNSLNEIINGFLDKFEQAGILLTSEDFDYTCYVNEYMTAYLEARSKKEDKYNKVSEIFERIYWVNPDLIAHIELNFRKLIRSNAKKFETYISKLQKDVMTHNSVINYMDGLNKLKDAYEEITLANKENITDVILLAKAKKIDVEHLLPNNKVRQAAYSALLPESVDINDKEQMHKICEALEKLKVNIVEYQNYVEFKPLFLDFKDEFEKVVNDNNQNEEYKGLKEIENQIKIQENALEKVNKKIFGHKVSFLDFRSENNIKRLKAESVYKAKELYQLYKKYDKEYFKDKVLKELDKTLSIADLLNLYYSFDYVKKLAIQRVYNLTNYQEIIKRSDAFDIFAMNPLNMIVAGIPIFGEENIPRIIANKYRLNNLAVVEADLSEDNLSSMLNKISLVLRINMIENSETSIDKIWFMVQVSKILDKEKE